MLRFQRLVGHGHLPHTPNKALLRDCYRLLTNVIPQFGTVFPGRGWLCGEAPLDSHDKMHAIYFDLSPPSKNNQIKNHFQSEAKTWMKRAGARISVSKLLGRVICKGLRCTSYSKESVIPKALQAEQTLLGS